MTLLVVFRFRKDSWNYKPTCKHIVDNTRRISQAMWDSGAEAFKQQKWPSRSLKVTYNGAIRLATYDFLLVFHFNSNMSLSSTVFEILSLISQNVKRSRDPEHIHFVSNLSCIIYHACTSIKQHTKFEVHSFTN